MLDGHAGRDPFPAQLLLIVASRLRDVVLCLHAQKEEEQKCRRVSEVHAANGVSTLVLRAFITRRCTVTGGIFAQNNYVTYMLISIVKSMQFAAEKDLLFLSVKKGFKIRSVISAHYVLRSCKSAVSLGHAHTAMLHTQFPKVTT